MGMRIINNHTKVHYYLPKTLSSFCLFSKALWEVKFKGHGPVHLLQEVPKQCCCLLGIRFSRRTGNKNRVGSFQNTMVGLEKIKCQQ